MLAWIVVLVAVLKLAVRSREAQLAFASGLVEIGGAISACAIVFAFVRSTKLNLTVDSTQTGAAATERFRRTRHA